MYRAGQTNVGKGWEKERAIQTERLCKELIYTLYGNGSKRASKRHIRPESAAESIKQNNFNE